MKITLFNLLASICYVTFGFAESNDDSLDAISTISYSLSCPSSIEDQELDGLWEQASLCPDQNTLELAKYYSQIANEQPEFLEKSVELLDYLAEARAQYPNFEGNPLITSAMRSRMKPHLMPLDHPIKPILDTIFATRVTENIATFTAAGFKILFDQQTSFVKVAYHPSTPGYLYKVYFDDEVRQKSHKPGWHWLCNRCEGAAKIRRLIKKKKFIHFTVPDKWLYPLNHPNPSSPSPQPVILVVTDMNIRCQEETIEAWQTKITKRHMDELYAILKNGGGSRFLSGNVPYTHSGKFAFVDTEYPKRKVNVAKITPYLSPEMQKYWKKLTKK